MKERSRSIDILRGILIVLVVMAHFSREFPHDILFLFHMPLFFILSGLLLNQAKLTDETSYLLSKMKSLLLPYVIYLIIDTIFVQGQRSIGALARAIWGGRVIGGVYWYITCYLFALYLLSLLLNNFSDRASKILILAGGGIAIIESHLSDKISFLQSPGVPWNLDVSLMALVYIGIGFFYKKQIKELLESDSKYYDMVAGITVAGLIELCWFIYRDGNRIYYFDMKPVYYKELVSAILIPCAFGIVLVRLVHWMEKVKWIGMLNRFFVLCGRATIPIMFMHIPLNHWKDAMVYGRCVYVLIGVGVPLVFTSLFNRYGIMRKLFGLPNLQKAV